MDKIGAIVQARLSSTRLPQKILKTLPFAGTTTVLEQVIRRLKKSKRLEDIIIATTIEDEDNEIVKIAKKENVRWFTGDRENVLERHYLSAKENKVNVIVRITSDCPCVDPEIVDLAISEHLESKSDYTTNTFNRTFPHGLDVEVVNFDVLEKAHLGAKYDYEKEHVTPYIFKTNPHLFKIGNIDAPKDLYAPEIRVTLDTEEDYTLLCTIFDYLYPENEYFSAKELVDLFKQKPWLKLINKKVLQKKIFNTLNEEVKEAIRILDLQGLKKAKQLFREHRK